MKKISLIILLLYISSYKLFPAGEDINYKSRLMMMKTAFERINDYCCQFESFSRLGEKSASVSFKCYFKKPKLVRMEILTGKYSGTILLYQGGEDVRLKLSNMVLGLFTFSFSPDHRYVCDVRGNGLHNSDWGYFINEHIKMLELTESRYIGEEKLDKRNVLVFELLSKDPSQSRSIAKEVLWIDKYQNILIKYMQYDKEGILLQSGYYKDIMTNRGLKHQLFTDFKDQ